MTHSLPSIDQRYPVEIIRDLHPVLLADAELLRQTKLRAQRRSGPGGQHRNKTSSGVFLAHLPSGIVAEATERRSQAQNRSAALQRLRFKLAVEIRTPSILDGPVPELEQTTRDRLVGSTMRLADSNPMKPPLLALVLNDLHASGGNLRVVAGCWSSTSSALVRLTRSHPPALQLLQSIRNHHGLRPLS